MPMYCKVKANPAYNKMEMLFDAKSMTFQSSLELSYCWFLPVYSATDLMTRALIRYDTIAEFNVDLKAEYTA